METRCTCGQGHATFGACVRAKNLRVGYCQSAANNDLSLQKAHDRELALYKSARDQGIQPGGTTTAASRYALDQSDRYGKAFDAGNPLGVLS